MIQHCKNWFPGQRGVTLQTFENRVSEIYGLNNGESYITCSETMKNKREGERQ